MHVSDAELVGFLLDAGLVSRRDLEAALRDAEAARLPLERVVVRRGLLSDKDLRWATGHILGIPFIDLSDAKLDLALLSHIPEPVSRAHNAVAVRKAGPSLEVALLDLRDLPELKFVERLHDVSVRPCLTDPESMKRALVFYQDSLRREYGDAIEQAARGLAPAEKPLETHTETELRALAEEGRASRLFDALLEHALLSKATHIHIEPGPAETRVRYRIGGRLREAVLLPKHVLPRLGLRAKHVAGLPLRPGAADGKFVMRGESETPFRLSIMPTSHGEKVMMRVLPREGHGFTLESLGLRGEALEAVEESLEKGEGLILAAGPKASGRSTFLYTALDLSDDPRLSIHTIEPMIEFVMPRAHQTVLDPAQGLTMARALRGAARADADVIMAAELHEAEAVKVASAAALSGELVLAGVTADSAAGGIVKFIELGADKALLASALTASVGMRVVPRLGRDRERYFLNANELRSLGALIDLEKMLTTMKREGVVTPDAHWTDVPFWRARRGSAAEGYVGLYETLVVTPRLRELVMNNPRETSLIEEAKRSGMVTLLEDGIIKAVQGLTTLEAVLRAVS